jgi:hypothetical protein
MEYQRMDLMEVINGRLLIFRELDSASVHADKGSDGVSL